MVNKLKYIKSAYLICFLLLISCKYLDDNYKYKPINPNSEFDFTVNNVELKNGIILNNEYYYGGGNFLQNGNNYPDWILKENALDDGTVLISDDEELLLDIWKIKTPYEIYKKKHSNILYLVKNNETFKFRIYY